MRDKVHFPGILVTSKPNGGALGSLVQLDARAAGAAMQSGNFAEAGSLLNAGWHPDAIRTPQGASALMCCVTHNDLAFAKRLLTAGADPDRAANGAQEKTYLGHALSCESPRDSQPMLQLLLKFNANPMLPIVEDGPLPLHFAAENALAGPARILAAYRADPFAVDPSGKTAVELAMGLPDFQKSLMLLALIAPPASSATMDRLAGFFGPDEAALVAWLRHAWEDDDSM